MSSGLHACFAITVSCPESLPGAHKREANDSAKNNSLHLHVRCLVVASILSGDKNGKANK